MAVISDQQKCETVIVTFPCKKEQQDDLFDKVRAYVKDFISVQEGFISSHVHRSTCGEFVLNYAQWQSMEHFMAFAEKAQSRPELPALYEYGPTAAFYRVEYSVEA